MPEKRNILVYWTQWRIHKFAHGRERVGICSGVKGLRIARH